MKILIKVLNISDYALRIILVLLSIAIFALAAFGLLGKQLCENESTCYALIAFLGGVIVTLKIKILDFKKNLKELIVFIVGVLSNILFIFVAFFLGCRPEHSDKALILLNATIWLDFCILIRSLYLVIIIYAKELYAPWKEKRDKTKAIKDDLFSFWLNRENKSTAIKRALTDKSYMNVNPSLKTENTNFALAIYGDSIIKMCLSKLLLDKVDKLTQEKAKYESDEFLVKRVAKHYNLLIFIKKDSNDKKMPEDYNYVVKKGNNPHKYIATAVKAMIGAIYIETKDYDAIAKLIYGWRIFLDS